MIHLDVLAEEIVGMVAIGGMEKTRLGKWGKIER